jgi:Zn-dependent M28 family amino/carboxypeptidase
MKKLPSLFYVLIILLSCGTTKSDPKKVVSPTEYANTINASELKDMLYTYASDEFEGRETGQPGQKKAVEYLKNYYIALGIPSPLGNNDYYQEISSTYLKKGVEDSENVVAFIKGTEKPDEIIVISAHLDHIGIKDGQIYNGADDDGSGTIAMLEIAEAFKKAANEGHGPKRSILFLHVTGEEKGLLGSKYYTDIDPIFPLANTVANLNIDMVGRIDPKHENNRNYLYLIGSNRLSSELHDISEEINKKYTHIDFDYTYNDENDPNRFYSRSDHYNFAKNNVPVIFYFSGTHADYHKASDTPDKIEYDLYETRTRLVFYTAWELANRTERIKVDKSGTN